MPAKRTPEGNKPATVLLLACFVAGAQSVFGQQSSSAETLWQQAEQARMSSQWQSAAQGYQAYISAAPDSINAGAASVRLAESLERSGKTVDALEAYNTALSGKMSDYWRQLALLNRGELCLKEGCRYEAEDSIFKLQAQYPEASASARAALLLARLSGADTRAAEMLCEDEAQASELLGEAEAAAKTDNNAMAIELSEQVAAQFPDTPAALRALDMAGHLLIRNGDTERAATVLQIIVETLKRSAPNARILDRAKLRIAANHHRQLRRNEALAMYSDLEQSSDTSVSANAALQKAGIEFELLQHPDPTDGALSKETWAAIRQSCEKAAVRAGTSPQQRARAELMAVETYDWENDEASTLFQAEAFLDRHKGENLRQELATCHYFAGEAAFELAQYDIAVVHFRAVLEAYPTEKYIWGNMDHIPRTMFGLWRSLKATNAPDDEAEQVKRDLAERFPESNCNYQLSVWERALSGNANSAVSVSPAEEK